jgi:hypothetical protein
MQATSQFWHEYKSLVDRYYRPVVVSDGIPETNIIETEKRLGFRLPKILRNFYLLVGKYEDINCSYDRLISLDKLEIINDTLLFFEENQGVVFWGIPIDRIREEDPAVFYTENRDIPNWELFQRQLSQFLITMLLWQGVMGEMNYSGVGIALTENILSHTKDWQQIPCFESWGGSIFNSEGLYYLYS